MNTQAQKFINKLRQTGLQEITAQDKPYTEFKITDDKVIRVYSNENAVLIAYVLLRMKQSIYISNIKNFIRELERFINYKDITPVSMAVVLNNIAIDDYIHDPSYERLLKSICWYDMNAMRDMHIVFAVSYEKWLDDLIMIYKANSYANNTAHI